MNGTYLRFYMHEKGKHRHRLAWQCISRRLRARDAARRQRSQRGSRRHAAVHGAGASRGEQRGALCQQNQFALGCVLAEMLTGGRVPADQTLSRRRCRPHCPARLSRPSAARSIPIRYNGGRRRAFATALRRSRRHACTSAAAPVTRASRSKAPFAWVNHRRRERRARAVDRRVDYGSRQLEQAGAISPPKQRAFRERTGYADFGWAVVGRTDRLGPLTDPRAYARAGELVVIIHGGMSTRESWANRHARRAVQRSDARFVPDLAGYGSRGSERACHTPSSSVPKAAGRDPRVDRVRRTPVADRARRTLARGPRCSPRTRRPRRAHLARRRRSDLPAVDWRQRRGLLALRRSSRSAWIPGVKRYSATDLRLVRQRGSTRRKSGVRMLDAFLSLPILDLVRSAAYAATSRRLPSSSRARVVRSGKDPVAPIERMRPRSRRSGSPTHQIHRLVVPRAPSPRPQTAASRVDASQHHRADGDHRSAPVAAREGTVLPTQVASTLMSDGSSTQSA